MARATALCALFAALVATATARADPTTTTTPCSAAGLVAIVRPDATAPVTEGPAVSAATAAGAAAPAFADPQAGVELTGAAAGAAGCVEADAPGGTHAAATSWSVFDGAVSGGALRADLLPAEGDGSGWHLRVHVEKLAVAGSSVDPIPGATVAVSSWGTLTIRAQVELDRLRPLTWWAAALELRLDRAHAGLPAGTIVLIGYAAANRAPASAAPAPPPPATTTAPAPAPPAQAATTPKPKPKPAPARPVKAPTAKRHPAVRPKPARRTHPRRVGRQPLAATPGLGGSGYVFPVATGADWGDTYGAERSDVPGGWHHGDDLFAPLGTPAVAVADGTVFAVGWNRVGGWRLWLVDRAGNDFYYAHLSGYTRLARNGVDVRRGDVLGFVGNTGDAFTTEPHLHFEVHPAPLLYLGYDGAVDPTSYLRGWPLPQHVHVLPPTALPGRAPAGFGSAADYRRLLAVRPRPTAKAAAPARPAPRATRPQRHALPAAPTRLAATGVRHGGNDGPLAVAFGIVLLAAALAALVHAARDGRT
ncbi:MAG TPA: M23 family metallopeptidase [Gaiellaceae bacterium]